MKTVKMMKMVIGGAAVALLGFALVACGTGPAPTTTQAGGATVSVPVVGEWEVIIDENDGGSSTNMMTEVEMDGMVAWRFAGEVTEDFQYGYAGMQRIPDANTLANLAVMESISFMVLGDGQRYSIRLESSNVQDYGFHEFLFETVAGEAIRVEVPVRMFFQPAWASMVTFRQDLVTSISFQTHESWRPGPFEITLWDITMNVPADAVVVVEPSDSVAVELEAEEVVAE